MKNGFFDEMNQLPPGYTESFNEDEYIDRIAAKKIDKGTLGTRDKFQELIFGQNAKNSLSENQLLHEFETLITSKGYKQTQQGRQILVEAFKQLRKLGIITD